MKVGVLHSRIRRDEKLLLNELRERDHAVHKLDVRDRSFSIDQAGDQFATLELVVDRCLSSSRSRYLTAWCERHDIPVVNSATTAATCADKVRTSLALSEAGIPTPRTEVAFSIDAALDIMDDLGYPCVLKPVVGSWGRLMARIESRNMAESLLEHKATLGHYEHKVFYLQEYIETEGEDLRIVATDGVPIAGMRRSSDHWITNAARGAEVASIEVDSELETLVANVDAAVGGGLLGIDLMETQDGYTVHEVNHSVEFNALNSVAPIDVPSAVVDWLESICLETTAVSS